VKIIDTYKIKSTHWSELLLQMNAISDCYDYARTISYKKFWYTCQRGDWLLSFAANEGSTSHKLIVKAACQCARLSLPYIKQVELIPLKSIETTERWLEDKATIEEVKLAADAAYAYAYTYIASVYASAAASHAAFYAVSDAAYATDAASKKEMQQKTADIVRSIISMPTQAVNEFERLVKMKAFW